MVLNDSIPIFVQLGGENILIGTMMVTSSYMEHDDNSISRMVKIKRIKILHKKGDDIYFNTKTKEDDENA